MKSKVPLKSIPMVNGDGHGLQVCSKCFGGGTHHLATLVVKNGQGIEQTKTANLQQGQFKKYLKEGWLIQSSKCAECKGAGTVLSSQPGSW